MTRRQANTLMALVVALTVPQIACEALLLRGQVPNRRNAKGKTEKPDPPPSVTKKKKRPSANKAKGKHSKATNAKPRKLAMPPRGRLIFDPAPIELQLKR